ncbi:MAG: replication initiator protein [Microvirus sp.]|nr:MAG: replication initiator protein [Microvirus sp.]
MPCYSPLTGYRSAAVNPKTGKRGIVFNTSEGFRDLPVTVPCGSCIGCRIDRSRQWAIRCTHEAQMHEEKCFVTVTYEDSNLPAAGSLIREDLQKFLKRLRKANPARKIRYFYCGEYGEQTLRPHYHLCLFGIDWRSEWQKISGGDNPCYTAEGLAKLWPFGNHTIQDFTEATAAYTARYCIKKVNGDRAEKHYTRIDSRTGELVTVKPEFIGMSLKPAIGQPWLDKFKSDLYPRDEVILKGRKLTVPKYYDRQLEKSDPALLGKLKAKRQRRALRNRHDSTPRRLRDRAEVQTLKLKTLTRKI